MTITQLEYIVAVDTYRSFVAAAEKCFVTQPTLSMQVQKLEDTLGVKLFDRSKQPVTPTEIGSEIISQARILLGEAEKIREIITDRKKRTLRRAKSRYHPNGGSLYPAKNIARLYRKISPGKTYCF